MFGLPAIGRLAYMEAGSGSAVIIWFGRGHALFGSAATGSEAGTVTFGLGDTGADCQPRVTSRAEQASVLSRPAAFILSTGRFFPPARLNRNAQHKNTDWHHQLPRTSRLRISPGSHSATTSN